MDYRRVVRIGMISVVYEEEEEDMIEESYGEEYGQNGDSEEIDTYGDEAPPPEYTAADEGYEGREGESDMPQRQTLIFGIEN